MAHLSSIIPRSVLRATLRIARQRRYRPFERKLGEASRDQREWLLNRVRQSRNTTFGKDHGFSEIRSLSDFRSRVPVAEYSYFAPYINAVAAGDWAALIPEHDKVLQFTITTGSTGIPKLNPVTSSWLREYTAAWDVWGIKLFTDHPRQIGSRVLQMAGSWDMGKTADGHQISMVSALLVRRLSPLVRPFYSVPELLNEIPDPAARHYAALRLCILDDIGWIMLMNPGTLIRLAEIGDQNSEVLIRDVTEGTLTTKFEIPARIRGVLKKSYLKANRLGGQKLEAIARRTGRLLPKDYWKQPVIACWLAGTAGFQSRYLREYFGESPLRDMGLVSSEGRHTIPLEDNVAEGVPAVGAGFYEFIPVDEDSASQPTVLEGHELTVDRNYRILISNSAGYFRFDIGDIVRCRGFLGQAPKLEFIQKSSRVGDLEGEKLTEHQVVEGAHRAAGKVGFSLGLFTAVPRRCDRQKPRYDFLVSISDVPDAANAKRFLIQLDQELADLNFLWRARRKEGVVDAPRLHRLPEDAWCKYIRGETNRLGTGDYQYKHPGLVRDEGWIGNFSPVDTITME